MYKILLIDDEKSFTDMLKLNLEATGRYTVSAVNRATDAMKEIISFKPDLILLDVIMPDMEGPDVAIQIKDDQSTTNIPVIFLTATVTADEVSSQGGQIGGHEFVAKPSTIDKITNIIDKHLGA